MKSKITKRDALFFFLGIIFMLLLEMILFWEDNIKAFERGLMDGKKNAKEFIIDE